MIFAILSAVRFKGKIQDFIGLFVGLALIAGALFLFTDGQGSSLGVSTSPVSAAPGEAVIPDQTTAVVRIAATEIAVEIATSSAAVQKGLSGRSSLGADRGMLFIFSRPDIYRFWMPDMHFPIDIIWMNDDKVIDTDEDVSPKFDPLHPHFYTPAHPVQYVLEVNAGFMKRNNIHIGDAVIFHPLR